MSIQSIERSVATEIAGSTSSGTPSTTPGGAAPLLPEPSPYAMGGDIGAEITALAVQTGQTQHALDTTAEETEDAVQDRAEQAEVSTMHDEASNMRATAWESGCLEMAQGAMTVASGAETLAGHAGIATMLKGGGDGLGAGATLASGLGKAAETDDEALTTACKATADAAQREGDAVRSDEKDATAYISAAIDFYREYQSTKAQAEAAAVHGA